MNNMIEYYEFPKKIINDKEYWEILDRSKLIERRGVSVKLGDDYDYQIAVFLVGGQLYGLSNICPHKHQDKMCEGFVRTDRVMCPLHGWTYLLETGENTNPNQGVGSLKKFELIELDGKVYLEKPEIKIPKWREV
jgi:nitrite reductase/ring-hydroxylating ferredoxin subunit